MFAPEPDIRNAKVVVSLFLAIHHLPSPSNPVASFIPPNTKSPTAGISPVPLWYLTANVLKPPRQASSATDEVF